MNQSIPYFQDNASFNPLFAKMRERFCAEGTIAERMAAEAGLCKKRTRRTVATEYHMTHGNSLPKRHHAAKKGGIRSFFSLKHLGVLSVSMLIVGTLFFSGATFESIQRSFVQSAGTDTVTSGTEESIVSTLPHDFGTNLGFTYECEELSL